MAQTNSPISNPVINTFCDLNTTGVVGSPSDVVDARDEEGNMSLLYRKSTDKLVKTLRKAKKLFEKEAPLEHIKILQGPAGAGKSYTLYSLVHFAIQNSWFVFYVADIAKLKRRPEETIAKELVQNFLTMNPEVESDLNLGNGSFIEKFRDLLGALQSRRLKKPLLVAIDQWNALFELAENHFLKTLDYLSQLKLFLYSTNFTRHEVLRRC
ncbi:hypothetical protein BKA69DRAFT_599580 [Paraphysoderma sedebokerense]|nr:hypothetical protein BKA69DRAFT_599580 [Paraphysoderma sedebokerense]